jgi:hypothetical protein
MYFMSGQPPSAVQPDKARDVSTDRQQYPHHTSSLIRRY